jgi:hypothetical protein
LINRPEPEVTMSVHEGGCLCGKLRFRVTAPALDSGYCHCRMCQRNSGAPVVAWVTFAIGGFSWTAGRAHSYASSARARREFCADCGSYLVFTSDDFPQEVTVNTASLDDPGAFPPRLHIFTASRIPWFCTDDTLPRYETYGPLRREA